MSDMIVLEESGEHVHLPHDAQIVALWSPVRVIVRRRGCGGGVASSDNAIVRAELGVWILGWFVLAGTYIVVVGALRHFCSRRRRRTPRQLLSSPTHPAQSFASNSKGVLFVVRNMNAGIVDLPTARVI